MNLIWWYNIHVFCHWGSNVHAFGHTWLEEGCQKFSKYETGGHVLCIIGHLEFPKYRNIGWDMWCNRWLYIIGHLEFPRDPLGRGSILDQWEPSLSDGSQSLFSSDCNVFATQWDPRYGDSMPSNPRDILLDSNARSWFIPWICAFSILVKLSSFQHWSSHGSWWIPLWLDGFWCLPLFYSSTGMLRNPNWSWWTSISIFISVCSEDPRSGGGDIIRRCALVPVWYHCNAGGGDGGTFFPTLSHDTTPWPGLLPTFVISPHLS